MRASLLLSAFALLFCRPLVAQDLPLVVTEYEGTGYSEKWVEHGVPIPQGKAFDAGHISLRRHGQPVVADFHPLAYWADGSIRWAKVAFRLDGTDGYAIQPGTPNPSEAGLFTAQKQGGTWTVATGVIRFTMQENGFNLFDTLQLSSNADGTYDRTLITSGASDGPGILNGTITLVEDGPVSKRFFFKENYSAGEVGVYLWITAYRHSGRITLEYTIRNGKNTGAQSEDGTLHLRLNLGGNVSTKVYGTQVANGTAIASNDATEQKRGAAELAGSNGAVAVLINRFWQMYPRAITLDQNGNLNLTLTTGQIRGMTAHGVDLHLDVHPEAWSDATFQDWADYYEFPAFALPPLAEIQQTYAWDGMFAGDVRARFPFISGGWEDGFAFAPVSPGYRTYGENTMQTAGNGHGLSDQMTSAFDRFLAYPDADRFLAAEELAIGAMESRGIIMDDVTITLDGTGYDAVAALFGTTDWTDPVEGRMWDSNHRGHYPITEYYYLTGKRRAAEAFDHLTKSSKYIFLTDETTRIDLRPSSFYLSILARNYSITRNPNDQAFLDFYWTYLQNGDITVPDYVDNRDPFLHVGFLVPFERYENDCGWTDNAIKPIFLSNWVQALYDLYVLGGYEQAMDHIYAAGRWLTQIYNGLGGNTPPAYCYRPSQAPSPGEWFWGAQDFPGIAIYYAFFGDEAVLPILDQTIEVYWDGGGVGYASTAAFALDRQKPDHTPPAPIEQIRTSVVNGQVRLQWQNVADAARLQIKYTDNAGPIVDLHPLDGANGTAYWQMEHVEGEPLPTGSVQEVRLTLPGDPAGYRFAMKTWDIHGNVSPMSAVSSPGTLSVAREDVPEHPAVPLLEHYPNPFRTETTIRYVLPAPGFVAIRVYDLLGREVETLLAKHQPAGDHRLRFEPGTLGSGLYWYRLETNNAILTRPLVVIR
ncbi:MAG: T9SS type A sorting domain-containing protein [Rhodothermales bacterium]